MPTEFVFDFLKKCSDPVAIFTLVLAIATIILAVATVRLWLATNDLKVSGERSSERQLRAYVSVTQRLLKLNDDRSSATVTLHIHNYGQTPAYSVKCNWSIWVDSYPTPTQAPEHDVDSGELCLAPNENFLTYDKVKLPPDQIPEIGCDRSAIWVAGVVLYRDAFGAARETCFRYFLTGSDWNEEQVKMCISSVGNGAT